MNALGKGLASLIPKRDSENVEDVLEKIDSMEFEEKEKASSAQQEPAEKKRVNVIEEFEDLEGGEETPRPAKPLVTPITIEPGPETEGDELLGRKKKEEVAEELAKERSRVAREERESSSTKTVAVTEEEEGVSEVPAKASPKLSVQGPTSELTGEIVVAGKEKTADVPEETAATFGEGEAFDWDRHEKEVVHVSIGDIHLNPLQPRRSFDSDEMAELVSSLEKHGILQPLVVRRIGRTYELVAGERRLRAAKSLKWDKVPCVIRRDVKSDQSRLVYALVENLQRKNLNPVEQAMAFQQLNQEYGLTHEEIGERIGQSRVAVTNAVRILQLPAEIQRGLAEGKISSGHARAILMIPDAEKQVRFYKHLVEEGLTVRRAEVRARRIQRTMRINDPMRRRRRGRHELALKYGPHLEERYGYDANVRFDDEKNRFEVVFKAHSEAEIRELIGRLLGTAALPKDVDKDVLEED